jgi:4-amino-4-deoxy-L-arabinose transferase-like glycosyltransferase
MGSTPRRGWLFYLPVVLGDTFPWSLLLVPAAYATWRTWDAGPTREVREAPGGRPSVDLPEPARVDADIVRLLWTWIATIVLFFSFSSNKQDLYVLPAVPAAAALAGLALDAAIGHRVGGRVAGLARWTLVWCGLLLAAGGALILGLFVIGAPAYDLAGASTIAVVTLTGGAVAALVAMRGRAEAATLVLGATLVCFSWLFVLVALPDFERYKPVRPLAEIIRARAGPDATVGYYRFAVPSLAYYMRRPVFEYLDPSQLAAALAGGRPAYCLVAAHDLEPVRASLPDPVYILASRPMFDVKLAAVLRRDPLPRMLLVSNRP